MKRSFLVLGVAMMIFCSVFAYGDMINIKASEVYFFSNSYEVVTEKLAGNTSMATRLSVMSELGGYLFCCDLFKINLEKAQVKLNGVDGFVMMISSSYQLVQTNSAKFEFLDFYWKTIIVFSQDMKFMYVFSQNNNGEYNLKEKIKGPGLLMNDPMK